jgi:hypothetical protein
MTVTFGLHDAIKSAERRAMRICDILDMSGLLVFAKIEIPPP